MTNWWYVDCDVEEVRQMLMNLVKKNGLKYDYDTNPGLFHYQLERYAFAHGACTQNTWSSFEKVSIDDAIKRINQETSLTIGNYTPTFKKGLVHIGCQTLVKKQVTEIIKRIKNPIIIDGEVLIISDKDVSMRGIVVPLDKIEKILKKMA